MDLIHTTGTTPTPVLANEPLISIQDVSLRFRIYTGKSSGLKEAVMRLLHPPKWHKEHPPERREFWGLKDINLNIYEGDRIGIIGHNGAGKSTLLKVISRIYKPTHGSVTVKGRMAPLIELGAGFNPELSARENIFLSAAVLGIPRSTIINRVESIIEFSGIREFIDVPVKYFSTGMHLRLAFTIATEVPPDILILDELYAGGDVNFITKANTRMQSFMESSRVMILVAHDLQYVEKFCNRAIILKHGHIVGEGKPSDMIAKYLADAAMTQ